jgi:hypothetical protein
MNRLRLTTTQTQLRILGVRFLSLKRGLILLLKESDPKSFDFFKLILSKFVFRLLVNYGVVTLCEIGF